MCLEKLNEVIDCDYVMLWGFPGGSDDKESACNARDLGWEELGRFHGEGKRLPTPVFLPGEFHGQRSLASYSPWGGKESDTTEWLIHIHTYTCNYVRYANYFIVCQKTWVMYSLSPLFKNQGPEFQEFFELHFFAVKWKQELTFTKHLPHARNYTQCFRGIDSLSPHNIPGGDIIVLFLQMKNNGA